MEGQGSEGVKKRPGEREKMIKGVSDGRERRNGQHSN